MHLCLVRCSPWRVVAPITTSVTGNLYAGLLAGADEACKPFFADLKQRLQAGCTFYYPDVMLVCDPHGDEACSKTSPCLIAEALSASTESTDRLEKFTGYQ